MYFLWGLDVTGTLHGSGGVGGLLAIYDSLDDKVYDVLNDANGNVRQLITGKPRRGQSTGSYFSSIIPHDSYSLELVFEDIKSPFYQGSVD